MIQADFIKKIEIYLDEHYDLESHEIFGEQGKTLTLFENIEIFFKKIFGSFEGYFFWYLHKLMKKKNLTESQLIEKANLNKNYFSMIQADDYFAIEREVFFELSVALQLNFEETNKFFRLNFKKSLHKNDKSDVIVAFFIENKIDDVFLLNETLEYFNLRNLGRKKIFSDEIKNLIEPIDDYINKNYVSDIKFSVSGDIRASELEEMFLQLDSKFEKNPQIFSDYLFNLIREKNLSEVEVYKQSHLDRRIFSKLRNEKDYMPSKKTILAIAFGMKLNLEETEELLKHGGYALSVDLKFDLIMKYFLENKIYDLFLINEILDYYEFKPICN